MLGKHKGRVYSGIIYHLYSNASSTSSCSSLLGPQSKRGHRSYSRSGIASCKRAFSSDHADSHSGACLEKVLNAMLAVTP